MKIYSRGWKTVAHGSNLVYCFFLFACEHCSRSLALPEEQVGASPSVLFLLHSQLLPASSLADTAVVRLWTGYPLNVGVSAIGNYQAHRRTINWLLRDSANFLISSQLLKLRQLGSPEGENGTSWSGVITEAVNEPDKGGFLPHLSLTSSSTFSSFWMVALCSSSQKCLPCVAAGCKPCLLLHEIHHRSDGSAGFSLLLCKYHILSLILPLPW